MWKVSRKSSMINIIFRSFNKHYIHFSSHNIIIDPYRPIINSSSDNITLEITGEPVEMWCNAIGMPPPSIRWFKVKKNDKSSASKYIKIYLYSTLE